jgi:hypothetical protein
LTEKLLPGVKTVTIEENKSTRKTGGYNGENKQRENPSY